jgi:hypothetical protein
MFLTVEGKDDRSKVYYLEFSNGTDEDISHGVLRSHTNFLGKYQKELKDLKAKLEKCQNRKGDSDNGNEDRIKKYIDEKEESIKKRKGKIENGGLKIIRKCDEPLEALLWGYDAECDGILFIPGDGEEANSTTTRNVAQIFRTYSLPSLLVVVVEGDELNDKTKEKILHALKAGVDYIAVSKELLDDLKARKGELKGKTESEDDNNSDS